MVLEKDVKDFTAKKLNRLIHENESGQKASLARMRSGIGREPGDDLQLWVELFSDMPEEMCGWNGDLSHAEWAVYTALTLFGMHQLGKDCKRKCMYRRGARFGSAMAKLIKSPYDEDRVIQRFNSVAMSNNMSRMANHLLEAVQLLSSKSIPLDYADLAGDLYGFQDKARRSRIRLKWGQDFDRVHNVSRDNGSDSI